MLKEFETILKNNGKDNPFENRILAKLIRTIKQLIQLKEENEQLTQKLEKARVAIEAIYNDKYQYTCDYSDCTCWDLAQQALKELSSEA